MAKLKLNVDALEVESFETAERDRTRGTVQANEASQFPCTFGTCFHSCGWSEVQCPTQGCRTDFNTCGDFGSCCPAECS